MTIDQLADRMQKAANQLPTCRLLEAVRHLGGGKLPREQNMTRAALISAYEARQGVKASDALMDEIGL